MATGRHHDDLEPTAVTKSGGRVYRLVDLEQEPERKITAAEERAGL